MRVVSLKFISALVIGAVCIAGYAFAKAPVTGEIQTYIVTKDSEGNEQALLSEEASPGQVMEFRIVFTNNSNEGVNGIKVVDPIPTNTRFIGNSHAADVSAVFEVSVDGGRSFELEPVRRVRTQVDGSQLEITIPPEQYTHVRWIAAEELSSEGGTHEYKYRVAVQ